MDLRTTLCYIWCSSGGQSYMLGDNELSTAAMIPPRLNKCHTALSYHRVREAISAGIARFFHISVDNSDIPPSTGSRKYGPSSSPCYFMHGRFHRGSPPASQDGEPAASDPSSLTRSLQMQNRSGDTHNRPKPPISLQAQPSKQ
jgi:hypothetical protein